MQVLLRRHTTSMQKQWPMNGTGGPGASGRPGLFILSGPLSRHTSFIVACNSSCLSLHCVRVCVQIIVLLMLCMYETVCFFLPNPYAVNMHILDYKFFLGTLQIIIRSVFMQCSATQRFLMDNSSTSCSLRKCFIPVEAFHQLHVLFTAF